MVGFPLISCQLKIRQRHVCSLAPFANQENQNIYIPSIIPVSVMEDKGVCIKFCVLRPRPPCPRRISLQFRQPNFRQMDYFFGNFNNLPSQKRSEMHHFSCKNYTSKCEKCKKVCLQRQRQSKCHIDLIYNLLIILLFYLLVLFFNNCKQKHHSVGSRK